MSLSSDPSADLARHIAELESGLHTVRNTLQRLYFEPPTPELMQKHWESIKIANRLLANASEPDFLI